AIQAHSRPQHRHHQGEQKSLPKRNLQSFEQRRFKHWQIWRQRVAVANLPQGPRQQDRRKLAGSDEQADERSIANVPLLLGPETFAPPSVLAMISGLAVHWPMLSQGHSGRGIRAYSYSQKLG